MGSFLEDPLDVPTVVLDFVAEQLGIADPSVVKRYTGGLPESPDALLAGHARTLDAAYREVGGRLPVNTEVRVDDAGKIHLTGSRPSRSRRRWSTCATGPPRCCRGWTCPRSSWR
nr:hypothetical protein [Actinomadura alba]